MPAFSSLFQPGKIASLSIQNRIVMPAVTTGLASTSGEITPEILAYYRERALGGAGVIVAEVACVDEERGRYGYNSIMGNHPRYTAGLACLAEAIKLGGARAFIQLYHVGRQTSLQAAGGRAPLAPSEVYCHPMRIMPEEATLDEIGEVIANFAASARVVRDAGFDGVELHAGHGYLLSTFISPFTNRREDEYGGTTVNRTRIVREIIQTIKEKIPGLVVGVRFNISDFVPGGIEAEEGLRIAVLLEQAGADYLNVSNGMYESSETIIEPVNFEEGWRIPLGAMVKERVSIPVMAGGVIRQPHRANQVIADGKADFVFIGRAQIADPQWVEKARQGETDDIRPCLSCNVCIERTMKGRQIACTVNPRVGRETWLQDILTKSLKTKTILVAGGGPAGMAAAAGLAKRGHNVVLAEKEACLGGLLDAAAVPPHKYRIGLLARYLARELQASGAEVMLNTLCDQQLIQDIQPDAVVVATGSRPKRLPFCTDDDPTVIQAVDLLRSGSEIGMRYLIAGGGVAGCETALYLGQLGHEVTLVEMTSFLARGLQQVNRQEMVKAMKECGVEILTGYRIIQYEQGTAVIVSLEQHRTVEADRLVLALGFDPLGDLADQVREQLIPVYVIGDAVEPRSIENAIYEAEIISRRL